MVAVEIINKLLLKDFMWFLNCDSLYLVLITLLLVRFLLNKSNLMPLASVCLTSFLCFAFFETPWALSPLVPYLLKDYRRSSGDHLVSREESPSRSNNDWLHTVGSPLEETFEKARFVVGVGSALGISILLTTIQIAWVILKKLDYTQELIKKLTERGWPNWLFFLVRHPNPGPVGGEPLFRLLIGILVGNVIVLYFLMKMLYFVF